MKKRALTTLFSIATIAGLAAVVAPIAASCSTQPTQQQGNNQNGNGNGSGNGDGNGNQTTDKKITQEQIDQLNAQPVEKRAEYFTRYINKLKAGQDSPFQKLIRDKSFTDQMLDFIINSLQVGETSTDKSITAAEFNNLKTAFDGVKNFAPNVGNVSTTRQAKVDYSFWNKGALEFKDSYPEIHEQGKLGTWSWNLTNTKDPNAASDTLVFWLYLTSDVDFKFNINAEGVATVKLLFKNSATGKSKLRVNSNKAFPEGTPKTRNLYFKPSSAYEAQLPTVLFSSNITDFNSFLQKDIFPEAGIK